MSTRQFLPVVACLLMAVTMEAQTTQTGSGESIQKECVTVLTAEQEAYMERIRAARGGRGPNNGTAQETIVIPVQHHIFRRSDGTGGLDLREIEGIMLVLNEAYEAAKISFASCSDPLEYRDDNYFVLKTENEEAMCATRDVEEVLNIYYLDEVLYAGINMCGYTYFPGGKDRLIIDEECARNGSTIVHEMGHYFSLRHTHGENAPGVGTDELVNGSNCATAGDKICDTPADPGLTYFSVSSGCAYTGSDRDAAGSVYKPLTDNHMSYSRRDCRVSFTADQLKQLTFSAVNDRRYLGCPCDEPSNPEAFASARSATLSWNAVEGVKGYEIKGRMGAFRGFRRVMVRSNMKLIKRLRPASTYQWKVRAHCENGGISDYTPLQNFTTQTERTGKPHEVPLKPLLLFPNPVVDELGIEARCPVGGKMKVEIFDLYGHLKTRWSSACDPGMHTAKIPVGDLPVGSYVINLKGDDVMQRARFEIAR